MASATASSPRRVRCQGWSLIGRRKPTEYAARRCQRVEDRAESARSPAHRARVHTSIVAPAGAALNVTKRPAARHSRRGDRARRSAPGVVARQPESRPDSAPADGAQLASRSTDGSVRRYEQRRPVTTEVTPLPAGHLRAGREVRYVPPWTQRNVRGGAGMAQTQQSPAHQECPDCHALTADLAAHKQWHSRLVHDIATAVDKDVKRRIGAQ